MSDPLFQVASESEIKSGKITNVYVLRTLEILRRLDLTQRVVAEVVRKSFRSGWTPRHRATATPWGSSGRCAGSWTCGGIAT